MIEIDRSDVAEDDVAEDLELRRRIVNYLHQRLADLGSLEVETHHGTAILCGVVPSNSVYWRCLDCCRHVPGVLHVVDRLVVAGDDTGERQDFVDDQCSIQPQLVGAS